MKKFCHKIQQLILLDEQSPIRKMRNEDDEFLIESSLEQYILACSIGLNVLTSATDKVVVSLELLERSKQKLHDSAFSHAEQIQFAIENYMIRSAAIYDRALIFINHLLDLGIADQYIAHEPVIRNEHVRRYGLDRMLKALGKVCREFSNERNAIIHHRPYTAEDFKNFSLVISANELSLRVGKAAPFPSEIVDGLTSEIVNNRMLEFENHLGRIYGKLRELLNAAIKIYELRRGSYLDKPTLMELQRKLAVN